MKKMYAAILSLALLSCSATVVKQPDRVISLAFPRVRGMSLEKKEITIPDSFLGKPTLVLIGYEQRAQFDIDRWILGLLQANIAVQIVEVPTIAGMVPRMVQKYIDGGMRSGIPQRDWASVVTVYEDAGIIIETFGNERPQSARAVLLNSTGHIAWTTDEGYSAAKIMELERFVRSLGTD